MPARKRLQPDPPRTVTPPKLRFRVHVLDPKPQARITTHVIAFSGLLWEGAKGKPVPGEPDTYDVVLLWRPRSPETLERPGWATIPQAIRDANPSTVSLEFHYKSKTTTEHRFTAAFDAKKLLQYKEVSAKGHNNNFYTGNPDIESSPLPEKYRVTVSLASETNGLEILAPSIIPPVLDIEGPASCRVALLRLFFRFGVLASGAFDEQTMDDPSNITAIPNETPGRVLFILTCKALRTFVNIFLVLFRAVDIASRGVYLDVCVADNSKSLMREGRGGSVCSAYIDEVAGMIKSFHVEASLDVFNVLQQLFFLAPGQRLVYRHNFAGMFNDISQVTYFHYPEYVRSAQVPVDAMVDNAMNSLPCIGNIVPELRVVYDDDANLPFGLADSSEWVWVVSVQKVYLWDGERLLMSRGKGVLDLAAYYFLCKHGLRYFQRDEAARDGVGDEASTGVKMTDFSHARLVKRKRGDT